MTELTFRQQSATGQATHGQSPDLLRVPSGMPLLAVVLYALVGAVFSALVGRDPGADPQGRPDRLGHALVVLVTWPILLVIAAGVRLRPKRPASRPFDPPPSPPPDDQGEGSRVDG